MKRTLSAVFLIALLVAPIAVSAGQGGGAVNRQAWRSAKTLSKTKSSEWKPIPGLADLTVCATESVGVTLSAQIAGSPAEVQVLREGAPAGALLPGTIEITPLGGNDTFSFTFVGPVTNGLQTISAMWRSPTGNPSRITQRTLDVRYAEGTCG